MKTHCPMLVFGFTFWFSQIGSCQYTSLAEHVYSEIQKSLAGKSDTIITYEVSLPGPTTISSMEQLIVGVGKVLVTNKCYVISGSNNKILLAKYIDFTGYPGIYDATSNFAKSVVLEIENDSLFRWLKQAIPKIENEDIHPFIYKSNKGNYYDGFYRTHSYSCQIKINTLDNTWGKAINEDHLQKASCNGCDWDVTNLNYDHNIHTVLYSCYARLRSFLESIDKSFVFMKN